MCNLGENTKALMTFLEINPQTTHIVRLRFYGCGVKLNCCDTMTPRKRCIVQKVVFKTLVFFTEGTLQCNRTV